MFLNNKILRHACEAKIQLETAVAQRLVDEGRRELDAKRSMVRHVSHEIRYGLLLVKRDVVVLQDHWSFSSCRC